MPFEMTSEVRKHVAGLLKNPWAIGCLVAMVIQQAIESSATYWLVSLTMAITTGGDYLLYLILYLFALLIPYIPGCIGQILKTSWKQEAQRSFINTFVASNHSNIPEWSNKGLRENKISILTSEGPNTLNAFIDYVWEVITYSLSVLFNILALSIIVEPLFALSYGISIICVFLIMKMKRRMQLQLTQKALIARVDLSQSLLASWDNVLLGNTYSFKLWYEKTSQRIRRCLQRNMDLERFDQVLAIAVSLITSIPSLSVVIYYMIKHQGDMVRLTSFVVILPLLFMILSYTYQTLSLAFRWTMHRSKLISIYNAIKPSSGVASNLEKKIKWPKIFATYHSPHPDDPSPSEPPVSRANQFTSHHELLSQTATSGRLTIRGENGCGKSTALMLIKNALAGKAFFLPTHNHLSFYSETNKYSTGESLRKRLTEILEKVDADVLLLDEWDANLDAENREALSELINELARTKCVVEVRHR